MGHKFERERMEVLADGAVNIGLRIIPTVIVDGVEEVDKGLGQSCEWAVCSQAHAHGWDVCDIRGLFNTREKDAEGAEIQGTSKRERLVAWLGAQEAAKGRQSEIPLPTRTVTRDGKQVTEPIRDVDLGAAEALGGGR